ncbi:ubiquinol-cytochrome C chaperone family protein [Pelagibacterium montanilacus]|uniref:ubiquinol-cytochrome C chaperone family protein n=1 Tax=Pelagibacterium montanilacus TaxID=2185280 RepID=UPI000F8F36E8|nr:ubiquinol-cytochrome C chaperone family protein [Pelagibacterium montanilacus]
MILRFFRSTKSDDALYAVYSAIVAQSRLPVFYEAWGVPDTVTGRFDMISLHTAMVFRRLRSPDTRTRDFAQGLFDVFFKDMDRALREMGVGDLSVGKKIEKMGSLFYGTLTALNDALDAPDPMPGLRAVIARNFHDGEQRPHLDAFATYIVACDRELATQDVEAIKAGTIAFREAK